MELIADYWISETIEPSGAAECGNHVAARWYESSTARFLDFLPPPEDQYQQFSLGYKMVYIWFNIIWFRAILINLIPI